MHGIAFRIIGLVLCFLGIPLPGCTPSGSRGGLEDACRKHDDCNQGELCNSFVFRCVPDVSVEEDELAGSFEFLLAPDGDYPPFKAGAEQKVYAKARVAGQTYLTDQTVTFGLSSSGASLISGLRGSLDAEHQVKIFFTIPVSAAFTAGQAFPLSDGLAPDIEPNAVIGRLEIQDIEAGYAEQVPAETAGGTFTFTRVDLDEDGNPKLNGTIAAQFSGTLQPARYFIAMAIGAEKCAAGELLDPKSLECIPAFSGMNAVMGFDSVYNGTRDLQEGHGGVSYLGETLAQTHVEVLGSSSFDYEDLTVLYAKWKTSSGECVLHDDCRLGCSSECGEGELCVQGSCRNVNDFSGCETEDDCQTGETCRETNLERSVCVDSVFCIAGKCIIDKLATRCDSDADCGAGERCDFNAVNIPLCLVTQPRLLEVRIVPSAIVEGAVLEHGSDFGTTVFAVNENPDGTLSDFVPIGEFTTASMFIRLFRGGQNGRLFVALWGDLDLDPGGFLQVGEDCQVTDDQCQGILACYPVDAPDDGWCFKPCRGNPDCTSPQECVTVSFLDGNHPICIEYVPPFESGCDWREMRPCEPGNVCLSLGWGGDSEMVCLPECDSSSGAGCTGTQECMPLAGGPPDGACMNIIARFGACGREEYFSGYSCSSDDICVGDEFEAYCYQDCTSNHNSCPGGFSCIELTSGDWACIP